MSHVRHYYARLCANARFVGSERKMKSVRPLPRRKFHRFIFCAAGVYNIAWVSTAP